MTESCCESTWHTTGLCEPKTNEWCPAQRLEENTQCCSVCLYISSVVQQLYRLLLEVCHRFMRLSRSFDFTFFSDFVSCARWRMRPTAVICDSENTTVSLLLFFLKANWAISRVLFPSHSCRVPLLKALRGCWGKTDRLYLQQSCLYNSRAEQSSVLLCVLSVSGGSCTVCTSKAKRTDLSFPTKLTTFKDWLFINFPGWYFHSCGWIQWFIATCS